MQNDKTIKIVKKLLQTSKKRFIVISSSNTNKHRKERDLVMTTREIKELVNTYAMIEGLSTSKTDSLYIELLELAIDDSESFKATITDIKATIENA